MNEFIMFWDCLGINSGQIQVVLNLIVIALAAIAALYARKQISIAQQQRENELRLSKYQLRLSILQAAYECKTNCIAIRQDYNNYKIKFIELSRIQGFKPNDLMPTQDYTVKEYLEFITTPLDNVEETNINLIHTLNEDNHYSDLSIDDLEKYLKFAIKIAADLESAKQGLTRRLEEIETLLTR